MHQRTLSPPAGAAWTSTDVNRSVQKSAVPTATKVVRDEMTKRLAEEGEDEETSVVVWSDW